MARADLPAFDIRPVGNHPVVPKQKDRVRLSVEHIFLEIPYQRPLFRRVGLAQHLVVEVDLLGVLKVSVVCGVDRARQVPLHVEHRVDDALAIAGQDGVEIAAAHCFEIWTCRHHALGDVDTDLAPLVDHPSGIVFIGLVDIAVQQLKAEPFGAGVLQETLRARDFSMSGENPAIFCSSSSVAASGEPGKTIPPTVCTLAILASLGAPCQRSIAKVSARRTRGSSNGFLLWLGSMIPPQFQSLSCTVILSPSAPTSSSRTAGGSPRNSIAARSLRIASTRTACLSA